LQLELARAFVKLGEVQGAPYSDNLGDTVGATENYKKAVELFESLSHYNPDNLSLKADLSRAYVLRANLMARTGESGYPAYIEKSVALNEQLVAIDPQNVATRSQLVRSYIALADYGGAIWRNNAERMGAYRKAFSQAEELCRTSPQDPEALRALITTRQRLSMNLFWEGKALRQRDGLTAEVRRIATEATEQARSALDACALLEKLETPNPELANYRIKLTEDLGLAMSLGGDERSISTLNILLESARTRAQQQPSNREAQIDVALVLCFLGEAYSGKERWHDASNVLRQSMVVFDEAQRADPGNREIPENRADAMLQLGSALWRSGDFTGASAAFDHAESALHDEAYLKTVILPYFRADMYSGRATMQGNQVQRRIDRETACGLYRKARDEARAIDFDRGHNDQTFLPIVLQRNLSRCESDTISSVSN
jgi:tetratricopeptide (TPR) repeat protein